MTRNSPRLSWVVLAALVVLPLLAPSSALAHCDGMDGPVVKAAQKALATGNVDLVLIWVQKADEGVIRNAFERTLAVRKLSPEARELADQYFFETLVRLHRAGEGAPYTGLQPAGRDLGPAIPAADRALDAGSAEPLLKLLTDAAQAGIHMHFQEALAKKNFRSEDLAAGRQYVKAYVEFIHYVERIYEAATRPVQGHFQESEQTAVQKDH